MSTVTISLPIQIARKIDAETKKQGFATRSEFIRSLIRRYFGSQDLVFEEFVPQPLDVIKKEFLKTGKYDKKFIDSMIHGLKKSSLYEDKTT